MIIIITVTIIYHHDLLMYDHLFVIVYHGLFVIIYLSSIIYFCIYFTCMYIYISFIYLSIQSILVIINLIINLIIGLAARPTIWKATWESWRKDG